MAPALQLFILLSAWSLIEGNVISSTKPTPPGAFELLILHNNDMHARFEQTSQLSGVCNTEDREAGKCYGGFPRVAYVVKEAREKAKTGEGPPVLYLNAGDTYTGTAWFTIYKWKIAAECLNALNPDAVSLGNHEFDNGVKGLTPFIQKLTSPVLAANLILNDEPQLAAEQNLKKYIIFNIKNVKVGVIGYLTPETKVLAVKNNVSFIDEIEALNKEVVQLKKQGVNIIIALGHSGFDKDLEIAKEVDGIDLVIGGHTNTFLWNGSTPDSEQIEGPYPTVVTQSSGRNVLVVQAYAYTKYLGKLHLIFDSDGEIISYDGYPILLDKTVPQDPQVFKIVEQYRIEVTKITEQVVGFSSVALEGLTCQRQECNLGNLIADGMVDTYASEYRKLHSYKYWTDAAIAIIQSGGIRSSITHTQFPITITEGDVLTALPFGGFLVAVQMDGIVLKQVLEHSVADYYNKGSGAFLSYSGIKVSYDLNRPAGSRIVNATVRDFKCKKLCEKYDDIIDDKIYKVLMPNFVSAGGDGYLMLKDLSSNMLSYNEYSSTIMYIKSNSPIEVIDEGRVILLNSKYSKRGRGLNAGNTHTISIKVLILLLTLAVLNI